ncbi:MAG: histidine phosphatase family protein [Lewinella sp.]|nr:histidine phosphatase family protein [Lewinella sp.]
MKKIVLIRHAKSSWDHPGLADHDRPLNQRGLRDAPFMAQMMAGRGWQPDALVSSSAVRARTTAAYFVEALGRPAESLLIEPAIYEASVRTMQDLIGGLDPAWSSVALFGHNPTFTMLANQFTRDFIDNLPTCGIVEILGAGVDAWPDFVPAAARVTAIHFPKQYFS